MRRRLLLAVLPLLVVVLGFSLSNAAPYHRISYSYIVNGPAVDLSLKDSLIALTRPNDNLVEVYSLNGSRVLSIPVRDPSIVEWGPNGLLAIASHPDTVLVYDLAGTPILIHTFQPPENMWAVSVDALRWYEDKLLVVEAFSESRGIYLIDLNGSIEGVLWLPVSYELSYPVIDDDKAIFVGDKWTGIASMNNTLLVVNLTSMSIECSLESNASTSIYRITGGGVWRLDNNGSLYKFNLDTCSFEKIATLEFAANQTLLDFAIDANSSHVYTLLKKGNFSSVPICKMLIVYNLTGGLEGSIDLGCDGVYGGNLYVLPNELVMYHFMAPTSRIAIVDPANLSILFDKNITGYIFDIIPFWLEKEALGILVSSDNGVILLRILESPHLLLQATDIPVEVTITGENTTTNITLSPGETQELGLPPGNYTIHIRPILTEPSSNQPLIIPNITLNYLEERFTRTIIIYPGETVNLTLPGLAEIADNTGIVSITAPPGSNITIVKEEGAGVTLQVPGTGQATIMLPPGNYTITGPGEEEISIQVKAGATASASIGQQTTTTQTSATNSTTTSPQTQQRTTTSTKASSPGGEEEVTTSPEHGTNTMLMLEAGIVIVAVVLLAIAIIKRYGHPAVL